MGKTEEVQRMPEEIVELINIFAQVLSEQAVFQGIDCKKFYSMAQHNLILCDYLPKIYSVNCLLFDLFKAILNVKKEEGRLGYRFLNRVLSNLNYKALSAFSGHTSEPDIVKLIDLRLKNTMLCELTDKNMNIKFYDVKPLGIPKVEIIEDRTFLKKMYKLKFREVLEEKWQ